MAKYLFQSERYQFWSTSFCVELENGTNILSDKTGLHFCVLAETGPLKLNFKNGVSFSVRFFEMWPNEVAEFQLDIALSGAKNPNEHISNKVFNCRIPDI